MASVVTNPAPSDVPATDTRDRGRGQWATSIGALMLVGTGLRLWALSGEPFDFHTDRQLYDVLMARGFWLDLGGAAPEGTADAVRAARTEVIEPPVTQLLAAVLYLVSGHESVWLVRALLAIAWVAAALPVAGLARRLCSESSAGVLAAVYWLLTPFGIVASRSFQPDALALVCGVLAVVALVRHDESAGRRDWWAAALWGAAAVFVKVTAVFVVLPVYAALAVRSRGPRALVDGRAIAFAALTTGPALLFLAAMRLAGDGVQQTGGRIVPSLLLDGSFWTRWLAHSGAVVGFTGCLVLAVALSLSRDRLRSVLLGLTVGYLVFGLVFTYHYSTHSYYHLPLVLPVALAWATVCARVLDGLRRGGLSTLPVVGAVLAVACVAEVLLVPAARQALAGPPGGWSLSVAAARDAGEQLDHDTGVIFLTPHYGHEFETYGFLGGTWWPTSGDLAKEALVGSPELAPKQRLAQLRENQELRWFLVADPDELTSQPELAAYLERHYAVGASGPGWFAYRLD